MRIAWYARKYIDLSLDARTWRHMVHELRSAGHETELRAAYRHDPVQLGEDAPVRYLWTVKVPGLNLVTLAFSAARVMLRDIKNGFDVILVDPYTVPSSLVARLVAGRGGTQVTFVMDVRTIPVVTGKARDGIERWVFDRLASLGARRLDGTTVITQALASYVESVSGVSAEGMRVWTSGVDVDLFDRERCDPPVSHSDDEVVFMYHGVLMATRGLLEACGAVELVREKTEKHVRLILVGAGIDRQKIAEFIAARGLESYIDLRDPVSGIEVPALICEADFGLVPFPDLECWRVSSPLKLLEYFSMGVPVVATGLQCNIDVANGAPYLVVADSSEAEDLSEAMLVAVEDRESLTAQADAAREMVIRNYTWSAQARELAGYLQSLLQKEEAKSG